MYDLIASVVNPFISIHETVTQGHLSPGTHFRFVHVKNYNIKYAWNVSIRWSTGGLIVLLKGVFVNIDYEKRSQTTKQWGHFGHWSPTWRHFCSAEWNHLSNFVWGHYKHLGPQGPVQLNNMPSLIIYWNIDYTLITLWNTVNTRLAPVPEASVRNIWATTWDFQHVMCDQ